MAGERRPRRGRFGSSLMFATLAVVLAAGAIFFYLRDRNEAVPTPAPPTPTVGRNEMIHVFTALEEQGLDVEFSRARGVPAGALSVPGQVLTVDGAPLYVFIFPNAETAATEAAAVDPATVLAGATNPAGTPVAGQPPVLTSHSNVIAALVGGAPEVAEQVERAIGGLP